MKLPYIKIQQKEEIFYLTKIRFSDLKEKINFHFRQAYSDDSNINISFNEYLEKIQKKGIEISADSEGIQRRLQLAKMESIQKYLQKAESFFPNTVILSIDLSNNESLLQKYQEIENHDVGEIELPDDVKFTIVDGQHRLAGLFISDEEIQNSFDVPVVLLINITVNTCAKIFADVNGTQTTVNKSVIYDLYEMMDDMPDKEYEIIKKLHSLCKNFNTDEESPLYQHIKMLGIGNGAISQSFFVSALRKAFKEMNFDYSDMQSMYESLFYYFKAFQRVFQPYWPVLEKRKSYEEFISYSEKILKEQKSQLLKTNGFGAIMYLFPEVYRTIKNHNYQSYYDTIIKLKSINWCIDDVLIGGTGEKTQKEMYRKLKSMIEEKN